MNKKYVKTKIIADNFNKDKEIKVNAISEKHKLDRMNSLFREDGNNMFEYNKLRRKIEDNFQRDEVDKNNLFTSDLIKEKKISDWINFKDKIKKEQYLLENESFRKNQRDEEEQEEQDNNNRPTDQNNTEKKNIRPEENFYNNTSEQNIESNHNVKLKKQIKVLNTNDIQNILKTNSNGIHFFQLENKKSREENNKENYSHLIKRKANSICNNVILIKPQLIASEKQNFFQRTKNSENKENNFLQLMTNNNNSMYNKKTLENKLKEFQSKIDNIKERKDKKIYNEGINIPITNQWKKLGNKEEEYMNLYAAKFEEKIKDCDKSRKNESNLSKSVLQNQSVLTENKQIGCFDKIIQIFTPDEHFLDPGQKKHNWHGKYGAFDPKFQDTREYRD